MVYTWDEEVIGAYEVLMHPLILHLMAASVAAAGGLGEGLYYQKLYFDYAI